MSLTRKGESMSAPIDRWIVVYSDGTTEEFRAENLWQFAGDIPRDDVIAVIRQSTW